MSTQMSGPASYVSVSAHIQHCRSCNAEIYWLVNDRTGKSGPIDAKPTPGGNIRVDLAAGTYTIIPKAERTGPLRVSHFSTCPNAARWHKDRKEVAS